MATGIFTFWIGVAVALAAALIEIAVAVATAAPTAGISLAAILGAVGTFLITAGGGLALALYQTNSAAGVFDQAKGQVPDPWPSLAI